MPMHAEDYLVHPVVIETDLNPHKRQFDIDLVQVKLNIDVWQLTHVALAKTQEICQTCTM